MPDTSAIDLVPDDVLVLAPGVRIHAGSEESGFVEDRTGVRRLQGTGLRTAVTGLLHPLVERTRVAELLAGLPASDRASRLAWLQHLIAAGLVHRLPTLPDPKPGAGSDVVLAGDPGMVRWVEALVEGTTAVRRWSADDQPPTDTGVVLVLADSVFDPAAAAVAAACVQSGLPHLVCGADPTWGGFVTPVWLAGIQTACFECVRVRLHANAPTGQTRWDYHRALRSGHCVGTLTTPRSRSGAATVAAAIAADRAVTVARTVTGADPVTDDLVRVAPDLTVTRHRVLLVPTCRICIDSTTSADNEPTAVEPAGLEAALDAVCGIVHAVSVRQADNGPRIHISGTTAADNSLVRHSLRVTLNGGAGFSRRSALLSGLGETVERYAGGLYRGRDLVLARYADLTEPAVHPSDFALHSADQHAAGDIPTPPFTEETPVRWVRAVRWGDGAPVYVPASQVFLPYVRHRDEEEFAPSISTGMAAGPSRSQAILSGLYEVLERDALAISWLHRLPPSPVPNAAVRAATHVWAAMAGRTCWDVRFHDLSLDIDAPVVAAVLHYRRQREDILAFGSACRGDLVAAVEKAFLEAAQGLTYIRRLLRTYADWDCAEDFSNVDEFNKHAVLYTKYPHLRERVGYLVDPTSVPSDLRPDRAWPLTTPVPECPDAARHAEEQIDRIVSQLGQAGYQTYVVDVTPVDVARLGVRVVRVLVPGLQHLSGIHSRRFLGGRRLIELPDQLLAQAVPGAQRSAPDNPYPHPLP